MDLLKDLNRASLLGFPVPRCWGSEPGVSLRCCSCWGCLEMIYFHLVCIIGRTPSTTFDSEMSTDADSASLEQKDSQKRERRVE
ncbi:hypothetical protein E2C01_053891 [Portunus trituberculatus]|uniref:Uncharacterized protein n=1 Tax=Portunus trituberculatus TaxID=210409 RepID=A0A5B7GQI5_PORTR|nr:hypothetical protein [Portunus trituberculatus]